MPDDADRWIKTGDSWRPLYRVLVDANSRAVDLAAALSVRFVARLGVNRITDTMVVMTAQAALDTGHLELPPTFLAADLPVMCAVKWDIEPADTEVPPGDYPFEIEVTWAVGDVESFPTKAADNPVLHIDADRDRVPT